MGYDVHIIRGEEWIDATEIPLKEWRAAVDGAGDLMMTGFVESTTPAGETLRYENPNLAEWTGHSSGTSVPFDFRGGRVVVKNPDSETIARMVGLAGVLDACVQGDELELYGEDGMATTSPPRRGLGARLWAAATYDPSPSVTKRFLNWRAGRKLKRDL